MQKINCITIDDEPLALKQMASYIRKVEYLNLCKEFDNAIDASSYLKSNKIDLIFLDIEMDEFTGLDFLESLHIKPYVILTTAYSEYALKGYEYHVSDYLLKPISYNKFIKSVDRVYDLIYPKTELSTHHNLSNNKDFIFLKTEYKLRKMKFIDILYIKSMGNYMLVKTVDKETIFTLMNFKETLELLPENDFIRIHKSYIISVEKIESISRTTVEINGEEIPVGESYRQLFYSFLEKKGVL